MSQQRVLERREELGNASNLSQAKWFRQPSSSCKRRTVGRLIHDFSRRIPTPRCCQLQRFFDTGCPQRERRTNQLSNFDFSLPHLRTQPNTGSPGGEAFHQLGLEAMLYTWPNCEGRNLAGSLVFSFGFLYFPLCFLWFPFRLLSVLPVSFVFSLNHVRPSIKSWAALAKRKKRVFLFSFGLLCVVVVSFVFPSRCPPFTWPPG